MTVISNNDIARAIYLSVKDKTASEQSAVYEKVVRFLFKRRILSKAGDILSKLGKIINQEEKRIEARVSSVEKLDTKTKTNLESFLKKHYGGESVVLEEKLDPELIGGLKVKVGDEVIDFSVKNRIGKLQAYLTRSV